MPTLTISIQKIGNYSYLAFEGVSVTGITTGGTRSPGAQLPPPPLNEAMLGTPPTGVRTLQAPDLRAHAAEVPGRAWDGWFLAIRNRLASAAPAAAGQHSIGLLLEAPSIDETDADWYAILTSATGITDPLTFTPGMTTIRSRYGRTFQAGDLVLIDDPTTYVDASGIRQYKYEIVKLTAIAKNGAWTIQRSAGTKGKAQFGTPLINHVPPAAGFPLRRLIDKFWTEALGAPATPQVLKKPWDSMCVPAVQASVAGISPTLLYLIPPFVANVPAVPGFRTLSGAEYTLGKPGASALADVSVLRLSVAGWHSIRNIFFEFDGAAGAGAGGAGNTLITLVYIQPDRKKAFQVATFTILAGQRVSYATPQQNTRMPAGSIWPPHGHLPEMTGALDANGVLQNGFGISTSSFASMQEDGELDYIITQAATTPGVGLRGTLQT